MKADLRPHQPAPSVREAAAEAIRATGNTHKGAATDIGIDRSRFSHKLKDGTLTLAQLEELGPAVAAKFGQELIDRFAPLSTPAARALHAYEQALKHLDDVKQAVLFYATNDRF